MTRITALVVISAAVILSIVFSRAPWFKTNEHVALWLEGIALVLIFVWDRLDAKQQHKETMEQILIAKQQSQFALNAERAWLTAVVEWGLGVGRIMFNDNARLDYLVESRAGNQKRRQNTSVDRKHFRRYAHRRP